MVAGRLSDGCQTPAGTCLCVFKVISRSFEPDNPGSHSPVFTILQPIHPAGERMKGDVCRGARSRLAVTPLSVSSDSSTPWCVLHKPAGCTNNC